MQRVYLPLASSAGWFERDTLPRDLDRRMKAVALMHDEVFVDDGSYRFMLTESGSVEQPLAPHAVTRDRNDPTFLTGLHAFSPPVLLSLGIDFMPLVTRAGLLGQPGVSWSQQALVPSVKRALRAHAENIARLPGVAAVLPIPQAERDALVKNWLFDSFLAHSMNASISVDAKGGAFVDALNVAVEQIARPKGTAEAVLRRVALVFALPDLDVMAWPAVLALRNSEAGAWLRAGVKALTQRAVAMARESGQDLALSVTPAEQAQIDEALQRDPGEKVGTTVVFAINFAPVAGFDLLNVSDVARAVENASSWGIVVGRALRT